MREMFSATSIIGILAISSLAQGQDCLCPRDHALACDKTVAVSLSQPCARQCVDFVHPIQKGSAENDSCSVREDVMSPSRPAYAIDVVYHPCWCLDDRHYKPVCTTKAITYLNECTMNCIKPGSRKAYDGECVLKNKACPCFRNYHPVCGTNGKSYPNECMFQCFKDQNQIKELRIAHDGACLPEDSPYLAEGLHKRMGKDQVEAVEPTLEQWLLSMIDFDRGRKKGKFY